MVRLVVFVAKNILEENERQAAKLRELFDKYGVTVYEFLGGPGSGKTSVIEKLLERMIEEFGADRIAYIGGDVATTYDTERIMKYGVHAVQINTGGVCHLEVPHVEAAIEKLGGPKVLSSIDVMIIENVGNLICPFNFPLGAHARVMVVDVTEGEDKFVKHPLSTRVSDVIVINKVDLAPYVGVNVDRMVEDARRLNPRAPVVKVSAKTGEGVDELYKVLKRFMRRRG